MNWFTGIAVYIVIWWISLFMVLPFGARSQHEAGDVIEGTEPGAPILAHIGKKMLWTAVLAGVFWVLLALAIQNKLISLENPLGIWSPYSGSDSGSGRS